MAHDQVRVEAERGIDYDLPFTCSDDRRQPARFAGVHEQEDRIVGFDELFEAMDIRLGRGY